MPIWIITEGAYEDEKICGVAESEEAAAELLAKAEAHPAIKPDYAEDYTVYGPFEPGHLYDWKGDKL